MKEKVLKKNRAVNGVIIAALLLAMVAGGVLTAVFGVKSGGNRLGNGLNNGAEIGSDIVTTAADKIWNYKYNGTDADAKATTASAQAFTVPQSGFYKMEAWGAEGGNYNIASSAVWIGKGGYTSGIINLVAGEVVYVYVGQAGWTSGAAGSNGWSFNGGQGSGSGTPGGGATDFRLKNGAWDNLPSLSSRIMVAGGGGGGINGYSHTERLANPAAGYPGPGHGGGLTGSAGGRRDNNNAIVIPAEGATQTSAGKAMGGSYYPAYSGFGRGGAGIGGGGGYYGGGGGLHWHSGGGGGSSFISGHPGCNAIKAEVAAEDSIVHTGQPNHYSGKVFTDTVMIGNGATIKHPETEANEAGHSGHGYARITFMNNLPEASTVANRTFNMVRGGTAEVIATNMNYTGNVVKSKSIAIDQDTEDDIFYYLTTETIASKSLVRWKAQSASMWTYSGMGAGGAISIKNVDVISYAVDATRHVMTLTANDLFAPSLPLSADQYDIEVRVVDTKGGESWIPIFPSVTNNTPEKADFKNTAPVSPTNAVSTFLGVSV